jgi:phosphatidate cytidylyltransferase
MNKNEQIIKPNEITKSTKATMKTRIITAIVGVAVIIPFIFLGDWFYAALVIVLSVISTIEIIRCLKVKKSVPYLIGLTTVSIIICIFIVFWPFLLNLFKGIASDSWFHLYTYFDQLHISVLLVFIGFALLFMVVVFYSSFTARDASFIFTMLVVISLGLQSLLFLRFYPSFKHWGANFAPFFNSFDSFEASLLIIYVIIATFMTDTGAYFFGLFFGKRKINERISPKKTYAGFVGGIVTSFVVSAAFGLVLSASGHPLLAGVLDINHWYYIVTLSALIPLFSTLGDFVFSSIKRFYEIKDYGNILPGHGGVLDRIDSLLFSLMASAMFVWIVSNIGTDLIFLL